MRLRPHPVHLILGLSMWALYFVLVYGGMSVGCEVFEVSNQQGPWTLINGFVLLLTIVFIIPLLWLAWQCYRQTPAEPGQARFMMRLSAVLYTLAAGATLLVGMPGSLYPPCL